jgi:OTU domain-containing protein 6
MQYDYKSLRTTAASFIREHKDDFEPFLLADEHSSTRDIDIYCREIEETAVWGGELEISALSRSLNLPVEIYSTRTQTPMVIRPEHDTEGGGVVRLAYYEHLYGLGQHYNGLHKIDEKEQEG